MGKTKQQQYVHGKWLYSDTKQEYYCGKSEMKDVDRKSRKTMTTYGALHQKSNVDRFDIKRKEGG